MKLRLPSKKGRNRPRYRFSAKQAQAIRFADAPGRLMLGVGSVRSGKTYSHCHGFVKKILALKHRYTHLCTTPGRALFMEEILPTLEKIARHRGRRFQWNNSRSVARIGNQRVLFLAGSDAKSVKRVRGLTIHSALISELTLLDDEYFKMILTRLSFLDSKLFADTNPDSPSHWLKRDWIDKGKFSLVQTFVFDDNPTLPEATKRELEQAFIVGTAFHDRYVLGKWTMAEGLIFPNFTQTDRDDWRAVALWLAADPGQSAPYAVGFYLEVVTPADDARGRAFRRFVQIDEYYKADATRTPQGHANEVATLANALTARYRTRIAGLIVDPVPPEYKDALRRAGFPLIKPKKDIETGLAHLHLHLNYGDIIIHKRCTETITELENYTWDPKYGDKPATGQPDHACDQLRYFCAHVFPLKGAFQIPRAA